MKKNVIISILVFLFCVFLLYLFIDDNRKLTLPEKYLKDGVLSVLKVVEMPVRYVNEFITDQKNKTDIYKKYKQLKTKVEETELIEAQYKEVKKELEDVKNNIELTSSFLDYDIIHAYTISRNIGYWYETFIIDKGENSGITEGMAVINHDGLIGKVIKTTGTTSTIKLLTGIDLNSRISVKIEVEDEYLYGLISSYQNHTFTIEGISDNRDIKEGSVVTTTGLDSIFPSGITIGEVKATSSDNFDLTRTVYMRPFVYFDDINYVMVLKRKEV